MHIVRLLVDLLNDVLAVMSSAQNVLLFIPSLVCRKVDSVAHSILIHVLFCRLSSYFSEGSKEYFKNTILPLHNEVSLILFWLCEAIILRELMPLYFCRIRTQMII